MTASGNGNAVPANFEMPQSQLLTTDKGISSNGTGDQSAKIQYCTFEVVDLLVGIEVKLVQEVLRHQQMTFVPLAPGGVKGLINLRGQIVTALDLRTRLGLERRPEGAFAMNAVIRHKDEVISLLVDRTRDVVEPTVEEFEPVPQTVSPQIRRLCTGTYKLAGRLLLILDTTKVVNVNDN